MICCMLVYQVYCVCQSNHTSVTHTEVCCMQIVKTSLSNVLLRVFDRWDRYEGRMRLKICAHILQTLQHLCNISTYKYNNVNKKPQHYYYCLKC